MKELSMPSNSTATIFVKDGNETPPEDSWRQILPDEKEAVREENVNEFNYSRDQAFYKTKVYNDLDAINDVYTKRSIKALAVCESRLLKLEAVRDYIQKEIEDELLIAEKKLGKAITEKLGIKCKTGEKVNELMRCIRFQMQSLVSALEDTE